jgi:hypothetical protein
MEMTPGTVFWRSRKEALVRFSTQRVRPALSSASVAMLTSVRLCIENVESCSQNTEYAEFLQCYPVHQHPQAAGRGPLHHKSMVKKLILNVQFPHL